MYSGPLSTRIVQFSRATNDAVQTADDTLCGQREVNLDVQLLSVEVVQHIKSRKALPSSRRSAIKSID